MVLRIRKNGVWLALNLFAPALMMKLIDDAKIFIDLNEYRTDRLWYETGIWAIRFLLLSLLMTPLYNITGWGKAIKLRKPAGLWAFGFALIHVLTIIYDHELWLYWQKFIYQDFVVYGIGAFVILTLLAITSNKWAMRLLRRNWKRLHRLVYVAGFLTIMHAMIAMTFGKKNTLLNEGKPPEMQIYLGIFIVLMALRVSPIKEFVRLNRRKAKPKRKRVEAAG